MYLSELELENLRSFEGATLRLLHPGAPEVAGEATVANVTLLLGNNGSGKTTVLRALALAALAPIVQATGFVPDYLIRRGTERARITARARLEPEEAGGEGTRRARLGLDVIGSGSYERFDALVFGGEEEELPVETWRGLDDNAFGGFFMVGYGAGRRVESGEFDPGSARKSRHLRYQRVASLFEDQVALTPLVPWLPNLMRDGGERAAQIVALFNRLMPPELQLSSEEREDRSEMMFAYRGTPVPYSALSDGYRAYAGWIGDLLYHLHRSTLDGRPLADLPGIVLLDEVDLHLHPNWQRGVVETIATTLPRLQFVLTSHSPIVTGTLHHDNILIMEADASGASRAHRYEEEVHGKTSEQVLLSSYFNLHTTRAPSAERSLREIAERAWKGDEAAAREYLEKLAE